jgi:hypothetical protein
MNNSWIFKTMKRQYELLNRDWGALLLLLSRSIKLLFSLSPANQVAFFSIRANKFAQWKTGFKVVIHESESPSLESIHDVIIEKGY